MLVDHGAYVDARDWKGRTPLMSAVDNQASEACLILIESGADVDLRDYDGNPVVVRSAYHDSAGADLESAGNIGWAALQLAADMGHLFIVRTLMQCGASVDNANGKKSAMLLAAREGHVSVVLKILKFVPGTPSNSADGALYRNLKSQVRTDLNVPLFESARRGRTQVVRHLLAAGAECIVMDGDGNTSLIESARGGHMQVAEMLMAAGVPIDHANNNGKTAALIATEFGHSDIAELLYAAGASRQHVDVDGRGAYELAARRGNDTYVWDEIHAKRSEMLKL